MKISINTKQIQSVCDEENIIYLGLFGSRARGDTNIKSDVDLLVEFDGIKSYFELARIQQELESIFKSKVDLVMKNNIKQTLKPYILKDLITLYEKR